MDEMRWDEMARGNMHKTFWVYFRTTNTNSQLTNWLAFDFQLHCRQLQLKKLFSNGSPLNLKGKAREMQDDGSSPTVQVHPFGLLSIGRSVCSLSLLSSWFAGVSVWKAATFTYSSIYIHLSVQPIDWICQLNSSIHSTIYQYLYL